MAELIQLPTGRENFSYSEFKDWHECSFRHKLKYIDKIDLREENQFSSFGTIIHDACQNYIETRQMKIEEAIKQLKKDWEEHFYEEFELWEKALKEILSSIPKFLEKTFPNWKYFKAEEKLDEKIEELNIRFVGYIDAVLEIKNKKDETEYVLIDWKTSSYGWNYIKRGKFIVQAQLAFYKKIWAKKHNIPENKVKCGFVILKRLNEESKCELIIAKTGPKTTKRSFDGLDNMIYTITNNIFIKNRLNCDYCEYRKTVFCPAQKF